MDINKIEHRLNGSSFNKTDAASRGDKAPASAARSSSAGAPGDKVSLGDYPFRNNDQLFAKLELGKLNDASTGHLQELKAQLSEFTKASEGSTKAAGETELGKKINDPAVWEDIAGKILR